MESCSRSSYVNPIALEERNPIARGVNPWVIKSFQFVHSFSRKKNEPRKALGVKIQTIAIRISSCLQTRRYAPQTVRHEEILIRDGLRRPLNF